MKTISLSIFENDYRSFRQAAKAQRRPVAQLIREAMGVYLKEHLQVRPPLRDLPVLGGHKPTSPLPDRAALYDEIFDNRGKRKTQ